MLELVVLNFNWCCALSMYKRDIFFADFSHV